MTTTIPFAGFYESLHSHEIDRAVEHLVETSNGDAPDSEALNSIWEHVDYRKVQLAYAQEYLSDFQGWFNHETGLDIKLEWDELTSPREYNFTTDRIFAKISDEDVLKLWAAVDQKILDKHIHDKFTSYDGFSSYYDNSLAEWLGEEPGQKYRFSGSAGSVTTWDHNQGRHTFGGGIAYQRRQGS